MHILLAVELHVAGNLTLGYGIGQLLQLDDLVIDAHAVVRNDEERIKWALGRAGLIPANKLLEHFIYNKY